MPRQLNKTKHFQAAVHLREWINTLSPGEILPVVSELTVRFGVSHGTAMRALASLAAEGIIVRPLGRKRYRIAERFEHISARICVLRPDHPSFDLDSMEKSIYRAGLKRNWTFIQHCFRNLSELDFSRIMAKADAMILIPTAEIISEDLIKGLLKPARPVVVLLQHLRHPMINNVCINDFRVGELAAEALARRGHKRILFLKTEPDETTMRERFNGFRSAAERLGLECGEELYFDTHLRAFEPALETAYRALSDRLDKGKPDFTALFSASLSGGLASYRALREHGLRVPEDVAVLAYSGEANLAPYLTPPLSSVEINSEEFGEFSVNLLDKALKGSLKNAEQIEIQPHCSLRESM
ncbi:MAG: substrate-binding domain-containing protein [Victivallales bacterium]